MSKCSSRATPRVLPRVLPSLLLLVPLLLPVRLRAQEFVAQKMMVHSFDADRSGDGRRAADAVAKGIDRAVKKRELILISRGDMVRELERSGFNVDSTLTAAEMLDIARTQRADEFLVGRVRNSAQGVQITGDLVLVRDLHLKQPIASGAQPTRDAAADAFAAEVVRSRAQMVPMRRCENAMRASKPADAATAALEGIVAYSRAAPARVCLIRALEAQGKPADSIVAVARALLAIDSASAPGLDAAARAYDALGDRAAAGRAWAALARVESKNTETVAASISALMSDGNAALAAPIADSAFAAHPEDEHLAGLRWLVLLATSQWEKAAAAGEALRVMSASYETRPDFFVRLATAYRNANQPYRALATVATGMAKHEADPELYLLYTQLVMAEGDAALPRGIEKFPKNGKLLALDAQLRRKRGDLQGSLAATRRALAQDSTLSRGYMQLAQAFLDVQQPDSALAVLTASTRTAADSGLVGQFALARGNELYRSANASRKRGDFESALRWLQLANRVSPSPSAGFLSGSAAFGVAQLAATEASTAKSCELASLADSSLATAETGLGMNRDVAPDAAKQFLDYLGQLKPVVAQQVKAYCAGRG